MRPGFHFTAERGWINDPHGITIRNGEYHAFYQFVPDSLIWGPNCHWGHAVGPDLFSLEHRPVALAPGSGDDGIWTGALVDAGDAGARIFYTSTVAADFDLGRVRIARPQDDEWNVWTKDDEIVVRPPRELDVTAFRDPFVFRDADGWQMLVGAALRDGSAAALRYSSSDLEAWSYEGIAASRSSAQTEPVWMGGLWECPQLFEIDGRHVLLTSVWHGGVLHFAGYGVGRYEDGRFVADTWGRLSFGTSYYAPSFFRDEEGRPCLTFWMRGVRNDSQGWSGAHSVPQVLALQGDRLVASPHPSIDRYRGDVLAEGAAIDGHAVDISWTPGPQDVMAVHHGDQQTLRIEHGDGILVVFAAGDASTMPYDGGPIRLILDGPTVEISAAGGVLGAPMSATSDAMAVRTTRSQPEIRVLAR